MDTSFTNEGVQRKPQPEENVITILPIPGTAIAIRVWTGSLTRSEFNLDFCDMESKTAIDIPDGYLLVHLQPPHTYLPHRPLVTLEDTFADFGGGPKRAGGTYVLRDGLTFALVRVQPDGKQILVMKHTIASSQ